MNIFKGSRRIAKLIGASIIAGFFSTELQSVLILYRLPISGGRMEKLQSKLTSVQRQIHTEQRIKQRLQRFKR